jgi:hypothetical protein
LQSKIITVSSPSSTELYKNATGPHAISRPPVRLHVVSGGIFLKSNDDGGSVSHVSCIAQIQCASALYQILAQIQCASALYQILAQIQCEYCSSSSSSSVSCVLLQLRQFHQTELHLFTSDIVFKAIRRPTPFYLLNGKA